MKEEIRQDGKTVLSSEDGSYSCIVKGKTSSGTYTFDNDAKTVTMKSKLGIKTVAYVTVTGDEPRLQGRQADVRAEDRRRCSIGRWHHRIHDQQHLADSYDGLRLGFELKK